MADTKISALSAASSLVDADVLAGVNGAASKKFALSTLATYMATKLLTNYKVVVASDSPSWWASIPGASVCDGTNDHVEINAAIVSATNSGAQFGTVLLAPGTYVVGSNNHPLSSSYKYGVLLYAKLTLECPDAFGATIKFANGTFNNVTTAMTETGVVMNYNITGASRDTNIVLRGLTLDWNAAGQGAGNGTQWGTLDVGSTATLMRVDQLTIEDSHAKNARATNTASPAFNVSVNTNGTNTVTLAANVSGGTVAVGDVVALSGSTASLPTNTVTTVTAVSGQTAGSTITLSQTVTGTAASQTLICKAIYEKWNWKIAHCRRIEVDHVVTTSDDKANYGATGFGAQYCQSGVISNVEAYNNRYHGLNNHESSNLRFIACHTYWNNTAGALCEYSRNVSYENCIFGGKSNQLSTVWSDMPINTSLGNGTYGISWDGSENIRVSNCVSSNNTLSGFNFNNSTDPETAGLTTRGVLTGCTSVDNGDKGFNFNHDSSTKWQIVNFYATGNTQDFYVNSLNTASKGFNLNSPRGGALLSTRTPAISSAYNTTYTNPFPFAVDIVLTGGTSFSVAIDGQTFGTVASGEVITFRLPCAGTINLGASASGGSWFWIAAS